MAVDGGSGDEPDCLSWTAQHVDLCEIELGDSALELDTGPYLYDTDTLTLRNQIGEPVDHTSVDRGFAVAIQAGQVRIGADASLRAIGARPVLIVARSITVAGNRAAQRASMAVFATVQPVPQSRMSTPERVAAGAALPALSRRGPTT